MSRTKRLLIAATAIMTALAAALAVLLMMHFRQAPRLEDNRVVTIEGTIACLPPKNPNLPHTLECAMGLKTSDEHHYALRNLDSTYFSVTKHIEITGIFHQASDNENYAIIGSIDVQKVVEK